MSVLRKLAIISAIFLAGPTAFAEEYQSEPQDVALHGLSDDIQQLVDRYSAPGLAVAVIQDGEIIYSDGFGYRDLEHRQPVTDATQFGIGSVIKSFTSGLVGILESEKSLSLSDRPAKFLPLLTDMEHSAGSDLKISHLLSQTSGLPYLDGSVSFFPASDQAELAARLHHFDAICRVGDCWQYNNLNFALLDAIAERVSGQSKSQLLSERLLEPIGMTGSLSSSAQFLNSPDAAIGYANSGSGKAPTALEYFYDEHVYATAPDLARWLGVWMNGGKVGDRQIIPAEYVKQAISMHAIDNGAPPGASDTGTYLFGYGYAWSIKSVDGDYIVHHGGNENGFSTHTLFAPAKGFGVVALTNHQNSILPNLVTDIVRRRMIGQQPVPLETYPVSVGQSPPLLLPEDQTLKISESEPLNMRAADLAGVYEAEGYGEMTVTFGNGSLKLQTPLAEFFLQHKSGNRFSLGIAKAVPAGIRPEFFEIEFADDKPRPDTLLFNIAAEPVMFRRTT